MVAVVVAFVYEDSRARHGYVATPHRSCDGKLDNEGASMSLESKGEQIATGHVEICVGERAWY